MTWYRAFIEGKNCFLIDESGSIERVGFYTTRFVEAEEKESAERLVLERLRREVESRGITRSEVELELEVEEIDEVEPDGVPESLGAGYTFYPATNDA